MTARALAMAIACAAALTGCSVPPLSTAPEAARPAVPAQWSGAGQEPAAAVQASWWQAFGDPLLTRWVELAQSRNNDVLLALSRVDEARANLDVAGAAGLPQLSATAGASTGRSLGARGLAHTRSVQPGLQASWEPDLWGRIAHLERPPPCACRPARPTATPWPWPWPPPRPRPMWACARCSRSCKWPRPRPARANRPCAWPMSRRASATPRSCSSPRPRPSCRACSRPWSSWSCRWRASARRSCCWPVARVTSRLPRSWQQPTASPLRWAHRRLRRPPACLRPCCSAAPTLHGRSCSWRPPTKAWPCSAPPSCPRSR